jgi:hypothetical protein
MTVCDICFKDVDNSCPNCGIELCKEHDLPQNHDEDCQAVGKIKEILTEKTGRQAFNKILLNIRRQVYELADAGGDVDFDTIQDLIDKRLFCKECGKFGLGHWDFPKHEFCDVCVPLPCPKPFCDFIPSEKNTTGIYICPEHGEYKKSW